MHSVTPCDWTGSVRLCDLTPVFQECMCNSLDSLQSRTMSRSSSLRSKSSMSSKGSGLSRILTLRRHHESDTDSFGDEVTN